MNKFAFIIASVIFAVSVIITGTVIAVVDEQYCLPTVAIVFLVEAVGGVIFKMLTGVDDSILVGGLLCLASGMIATLSGYALYMTNSGNIAGDVGLITSVVLFILGFVTFKIMD